MKKIVMSAVALTALLGSLSAVNAAEDGLNILNDVKVSGQIRTRLETADNGGAAKDAAQAFTARTRLAVEAGVLGVDGLSTKIGVTSVNNFGATDYNPEDAKYDTIVDAQQAILSEAYVTYKKSATTLLAGRSHINLDDQRFIGTVGWRQMERAYDTVTLIDQSVEGLTLLASYIYGYQGVDSNPTTDTSTVVINANYKASDTLNVSGFAYMLADIHDTYGVRATGKVDLAGTKLNYAASYAIQRNATMDYNSATNVDIDASYIDVAVSTNLDGIILGAEYEALGKANGTSTKGFTTPLATLHKFQGFADEFLGQSASTNNAGLIDMSVKAGYKAKGFGKALVFYHNFTAESGAATDLGSEIDALYVNKISAYKGLSGLLKVAFYSAGEAGSGHTNDNTKMWAQLDYKF